jgi:hypothetical protein
MLSVVLPSVLALDRLYTGVLSRAYGGSSMSGMPGRNMAGRQLRVRCKRAAGEQHEWQGVVVATGVAR